MLKRIKQYITENKLFTFTDKIICGVSGGVDSIAMCNLLIDCGYNISVAHCNFSLRSNESDQDQMLVSSFAAQKGITIHTTKFQTKQYAKENSISTQMAARDLRYNWFEELCNEHNYTKIAIAHNANDCIETFFINLMRGTGVNGLGGISVTNEKVVRPLLFASRQDIETYISVNKIAYRTDSSNLSSHYLRNWIRLELIPKINDRQSTFPSIMQSNINHIITHNSLFKELIDNIAKDVINKNCINLTKIKTYGSNSSELLYELIKEYNYSASDATAIIKSQQSGKQFISYSHEALLDRDQLIIRAISKRATTATTTIFSHPTTIEGVISVEECNTNFNYKDTPQNIAYLDGDNLKFPIILRPWSEGDKFSPLGVNGEKKVSDFLIDTKTSIYEKERQMVIETNSQIAWLVGKRISEKFKITPTTKKIIKISYLCREPK